MFLRDLVEEGMIKLDFCTSENQIADIMRTQIKFEAFIKLESSWESMISQK